MKCDMLLAGVGGQGILSVATVVAGAAARRGWHIKQSEVHGMAQRGGAVVAHLRMAEDPVHSDLIPRGAADLLLSLEPMESLRYLEYLRLDGTIASAVDPVRNIDDYPSLDTVLAALRSTSRAILVEAATLAKQAGNARTANMVMLGAVAHLLPMPTDDLSSQITRIFDVRGEKVLSANLEAFRLGQEVGVAAGR